MAWTPDDNGEKGAKEPNISLADRFIVPPFSVLDARQGYWQERKRAWLALGICGEEERGNGITWGDSAQVTERGLNYYRNRKGRTLGAIPSNEADLLSASYKERSDNGLLGFSKQVRSHYKGRSPARSSGQDLMKGENPKFDEKGMAFDGGHRLADVAVPQTGTSVFDPVLCEVVYRWFCPPRGKILDPFAGGSVRGIVAVKLGHTYVGIELSGRQLEANEEQAARIMPNTPPRWVEGDARKAKALAGGEYDLIFSCPPYGDLEVYSDDAADLSTLPHAEFIKAYRAIIADCVGMLKPNRFACFVVGDYRDKRGFYRNFVSDTIAAFQDAGVTLYNEAILITVVGSLPIRVTYQFQSGRKLGKTHQNVLVFYKGDPKKIKDFGEVECGELSGVGEVKALTGSKAVLVKD